MHVLSETNTPQHLFTVSVGLFDTENDDERTMGDAVHDQMIAYSFDVMTMLLLFKSRVTFIPEDSF
jgi:hypothetical protein